MTSVNGNLGNVLSQVNVSAVKVTPEGDKHVKLVDKTPDRDTFLVRDMKSGKLEECGGGQLMSVQDYINTNDKRLKTASRVLAAQGEEINDLTDENAELKEQIGCNLNCVA